VDLSACHPVDLNLACPAPIPAPVLAKWQRAVDLLTSIVGVPAGYVMRARPGKLEVCVSCGGADTTADGVTLTLDPTVFCNSVLRNDAPLAVEDGRQLAAFAEAARSGLVSYLGMPVHGAHGGLFGTICVLSSEPRAYSDAFRALLGQFRDFIEQDLVVLAEAEARRQMQRAQLEQLAEIDQLRRELLANVSHDLRTPLASLRGYIETLLLMDGELSPEARRRYLKIAEKNCTRLTRLVDDLFDVACLDAGAIEPKVEPFYVCELVWDVGQKLALAAEKAGVEITIAAVHGLPQLAGDIAWIERAVINLADNALRHTDAGGQVELGVEQHDADTLRLWVADTGVGIDPAIRAHIFDRYYRSKDMPGGGRPGSAGLGLPIAKRVVDLHSGRIAVHSEVGEGTTFSMFLPIAGPRRASEAPIHGEFGDYSGLSQERAEDR
jgi:hypothetical protein